MKAPLLNQLYFYLTEGCNLACSHCWLSPGMDSGGRTLPLELFVAAVREARPLGLSRIKLTGGEPLLHPRFLKMLEFAGGEGLDLTLETNGYLLGEKVAHKIARCSNPFVSVSLDGVDEATHDAIRGVAGSFHRGRRAVELLVSAGVSTQIIMSVMGDNSHQLAAMVDLAEAIGAHSVKFNVLQPVGRGEAVIQGGGGLGVRELIRLGLKVDTELSAGRKMPLIFDYPPAFRPLSLFHRREGNDLCGIMNILGVLASGHYALCGIGEQVPELIFGEVNNDSLEEIWKEGEVLKAIRRGLPEKLSGVCSRCLMRHHCLGSCLAQNYYRSGSFWAPFWFCEEALEAGLFPASRLETAPAGNRLQGRSTIRGGGYDS
jgi:SynChlorMet cassette radical SAM/SPASM protein ScmF